VRVVAATNRDLEAEVSAGRFRADLYHRLAAYPLRVPPLRERLDDLPILADHLLRYQQRRLGCPDAILNADVLETLRVYNWPGNVRELDNVLGRALLRALRDGASAGRVEIRPAHVALDLEAHDEAAIAVAEDGHEVLVARAPHASFAEQLDAFRRKLIRDAVAASHGNWAAAARTLGLHRANLHALAKRLGMKD
jgi:anaerobic nitric oxide reductase transcription regulator